jgi:Bacteriophage lambda head decoration protein D
MAGRAGAWLMHEPPQRYGRERIVVAQGGVIRDGEVVGRLRLGGVSVTADGGNSPATDVTITPRPLGPAARAGVYTLTMQPNSGGVVTDPLGGLVGVIPSGFTRSGHPFTSGSISFAIASAGHSGGDAWHLEVAAGSGQVVPLGAADAADGSGRLAGIAIGAVDATAAARPGVILTHGPAVVARSGLQWPAAYPDEGAREKVKVYEALQRAGIKVARTA